ncbi:hypothetical protein [Obesumbacterium proteus]|uniref:hypothetical protein n=1 Tax=Obesumbacterium proteus TaxID=82983 RepID=UPI001F21B79F|nr:hypothetical protein [Obesumbacterium proteus]MCE9886519.1 hypothetical protein [Obesumbacterium proteus]
MNNIPIETYESVVQQRDELEKKMAEVVAENVGLKGALHPVANEHSDCECTDRPVWYVVNPSQMMSAKASSVCSMFHGPFWSRERANEYLENTRYRYGDKVSVYCKSLYHYPEMRALYDASKNIKTPATDSFLAEAQAQGVDKLAIFAGKEYQRFVGDKPTQRKWKGVVMLCANFAAQLRKEQPNAQ